MGVWGCGGVGGVGGCVWGCGGVEGVWIQGVLWLGRTWHVTVPHRRPVPGVRAAPMACYAMVHRKRTLEAKRKQEAALLGFELLDEEPGWHKRICLRLETVAEQPLVHVQQSYLQEESLQPECSQASKQVYLVTLPALRRLSDADSEPGLQCPSTWDHETVARVLLDAFQRPVRSNNNASWGHTVQLEAFVVFRESSPSTVAADD